MAHTLLRAALAATLLSTAVLADTSCSPSNKCGEASPCCSQYGVCGVGAYCLGGCDPLSSHSFDSCVPNPVCNSKDYELKTLDDVMGIENYLGDPSKANWQSQGKPVIYDDSILLTMAEDTSGTLLASTRYVWYGKVCAKMTTSQGAGVVTAFILMSDVKDEIDFEFIGTDIKNAQSNYYSQGVTVYTNEKNLTVSGDTVSSQHQYCVDWQPDTLTWSIDGTDERTLKRSDTWNATANRFDYPQTPARIELSLWPAGAANQPEGTRAWAGGAIDWNSKYMQNGYYYAQFSEITVECYDPPSGIKSTGSKAYQYTDAAATNNTVEITDDLVILASLYATGEDPKENPNASSSSGAAKATQSVETVPGGISDGSHGGSDAAASSAASGTAAGSAAPTATGSGGFSQGGSGSGSKSSGSALEPGINKIGGGSALAIVVAMLGLLVL